MKKELGKKVGEITLYSVEDLSQLLDITERTVRKMLREETIRGKKLANKWYVTDKEIQRYFESYDNEDK